MAMSEHVVYVPPHDKSTASQADPTKLFGLWLRRVLQGGSPEDIPREFLNGFADIHDNVLAAHQAGGVIQVRQAFRDLVTRHPELGALLSSDEHDSTAGIWAPPAGWPMLERAAL
jgi:hypothetical protein